MAVEVLSPSTRDIDLLLKRERLQRAGGPHYRVVDPDEPSVTALALGENGYDTTARAAGSETFRPTGPFELTLTPTNLAG